MVFFTCNQCGESLKKASVDKHFKTRCRGVAINVSCMDCMKDFRNEEYDAHIKCITEAEKYSGKNYIPKESKNSGEKKQNSWMDIVRSILLNVDYKLNDGARNAFQRLQSVDNVPRKKSKFLNFVSNSMRMPAKQADEVWSVLEQELEKMKKSKQAEALTGSKIEVASQNGVNSIVNDSGVISHQNGESNNKHKKLKKENTADITGECNGSSKNELNRTKEYSIEDNEFQWSISIEKVLKKHEDGIHMEKLKRKILKKYKVKVGLDENDGKQLKKFDKKFTKNLKRCTALRIDNENVKLL